MSSSFAAPARGCPVHGVAAGHADVAGDAFDPFDLTDPFPFYAEARRDEPVFYSEDLGCYVVMRYADIKAVFDDWQTFSSENAQAPLRPIADEAKQVMKEGGFTAYSGLSARIPPDHTRIRKIVQGCFGPKRFKSIEPQIRAIVERAIDGFADRGEADLLASFAYDVPALVLFRLLGVPDSDVRMVKDWAVSRALLTWGNLSPAEQVPHAHNMVRYWDYCQALVARKHQTPEDDLPSDLIALQTDGAPISDHEIASICYSLLFAGHETTTTLISNAIRELLGHGSSWADLRDNPALIANAIEEVLRFSPSIVAWRRRAKADATVGGVPIPEGSNLLLVMGSGNRDEDVFANGEVFDIRRTNARNHISFGYGIHFCLGFQLAKLETGIALEALARRLPNLRLKPQEMAFVRNISFRVPTAVLASWDRPAS
ncbi:cytochrome P450 [Kaistia dalseonensis]|uniref:Cytochrome P450 n=1 Tax=Kaistia dalseonensis TaxID=410840 RepID=A0ABU0H9X9_9HYPH|nr:cytochrome P450 [Kaistia dalseonensis]MCX5496069.1 cytochrome P450 [Kaistia dalseonensis]MDQ0438673.1 cytochrome P450 [Kaistia dalseonensis]